MEPFEAIAQTYGQTRQADGRIVALLVKLLGLEQGSTIADIGAGTGNYSVALAKAGFRVRAIEPSPAMRAHAQQHHGVEWIEGCAEDIPLPDGSVDGIVSTLALPHFSDPERAFREMARVSGNGPIVVFTFDAEAGRSTWLYSYFPFLWDSFAQLPRIETIAGMMSDATGVRTQIVPFRLPPDLRDGFAAAGWRRPHRYLDEGYRANISSFRATNLDTVNQSVKRLAADLSSGRWEALYGEVLQAEEMDAGYRFLCSG